MQAVRVMRRLASTAASSASSAGEENFARTWGPIGKALRDAPNGVAQTRTAFTKQAKNGKDTYYAAAGDENTMRAVYAFVGVCSIVFVGGCYDMLKGTNKKA